MKRTKSGSTIKQYAYATRRLSGNGSSKKEIALLSGFSQSVAENAKHKIEDTEGYKNAVIQLAHKSNNLLLAVMTEFEARGITKFSNSDLIRALNAISGAWSTIEKVRAPNAMKTDEGNPLRAVFTRRVETQTAVIEPVQQAPVPVPITEVVVPESEIPADAPILNIEKGEEINDF